MNLKHVGIYKITFPNERYYVGLTGRSFELRWNDHLTRLRSNNHTNSALQSHFNKYGENSIEFSILEGWDSISKEIDQPILLEKEQSWWDKLLLAGGKPINGRPTGTGSTFHTDETRLKISSSLTRYKHYELTCKECSQSFTQRHMGDRIHIFCSAACSSLWKIKSGALPRGNSFVRTEAWSDNLSKGMKGNNNAKGNLGGKITSHKRWHINRNITNPDCEYCNE